MQKRSERPARPRKPPTGAPVEANGAGAAPSDRYHHGDLRAALLAAAEAEIENAGIEGFSLRAVAKRAGVSHAAPAHHFGDANGLLTALAAEGFRRFLATQRARQRKAAADGLSQVVASGVGYVEFAVTHPALFRLVFSSGRPDFTDPALFTAADAAFAQLDSDVRGLRGGSGADPAFSRDLVVVWALAHGLADLINGRRMSGFEGLRGKALASAVEAILRRGLAPLHGP